MILMNENAELVGGYEKEKFEFAGQFILADINYGFFIYAYVEKEDGSQIPAGFMLFTYEWSDWRGGLWFWMQSCHVRDEYRKVGVFTKMHDFLTNGYMKERGCVGFRLCSDERLQQLWAPIVKKMGMKSSHYYIFDVDVSSK